MAAAPAGQGVITATATDLSSGRTSELSRCATLGAAEPPPVAELPPDDDPPAGTGPGGPPPAGPVAGQPGPPIGLPPVVEDPPRLQCEVPKLAGLTLATAKRRLKAAHCGVGKVKKPKRRRGKGRRLVVKRAGLKAGAVRRPGTRVTLTLTYARARR